MRVSQYLAVAPTMAFLAACAGIGDGQSDVSPAALRVPVEYYKLSNGLRVVLSADHSRSLVTVAVYYKVGFRLEPRGRTGFAHLFEHLMFQGSGQNLKAGQFAQVVHGLGGMMNASTRLDYTNYFDVVPAAALQQVLWAEADRMGSFNIREQDLISQQGVVKEEVKGNILNLPYGGFPWLVLPQYAFDNWQNAHNYYGELEDIDAASPTEADAFFTQHYAPSNAALVVSGHFDPAMARKWIEEHFAGIPARDARQITINLSEPRQTLERRVHLVDHLAPRPALAFGYHLPPRGTPEFFAFGLIDEILLQGEGSWLYRDLVRQRGYSDMISGGINATLGDMFDYLGPSLWSASLIHDEAVTPDEILRAIDASIDRIRTQLLDRDELDLARRSFRSRFYELLEGNAVPGTAGLLACFALFDDDPSRINTIDESLSGVTAQLVLDTAREYLRPENRTVLVLTSASKHRLPAQGPR